MPAVAVNQLTPEQSRRLDRLEERFDTMSDQVSTHLGECSQLRKNMLFRMTRLEAIGLAVLGTLLWALIRGKFGL